MAKYANVAKVAKVANVAKIAKLAKITFYLESQMKLSVCKTKLEFHRILLSIQTNLCPFHEDYKLILSCWLLQAQ